MNIPLLDLKREYDYMKNDVNEAIKKCLQHQKWILGEEVKELEKKVSEYIGIKYCVGVASGTDALVISLRALAIKIKGRDYWEREDLVVTTPFTFTATGDAILRSGATPLFVDVNLDTFNIDIEKIEEVLNSEYSSKIVGILPVHLFGNPCEIGEIKKIAEKYNLFIVEDCAQSFGAKFTNKITGSFGDINAFSFFPSKNLGGFGDGGMLTTDDEELFGISEMLRKHGGKDKYNVNYIGYNSRLDTIQAGILLAKMKYLNEFNMRRRKISQIYSEELKNIEFIKIPVEKNSGFSVYNQYTIRIKNGK
ncbi:DegT/DnrJ/EryC1/StrS family aminotransferase, partial [bacterium]|nr:DegT/DnrJ/EryC1/StrS family aminotransferase [bacterium]